MKISKWEGSVILLSTVFVAFLAGWVLRGDTSSAPLRVETQRRLEADTVALSAPTATPERVLVDLNTADEAALMALPGIGEKRAADIVADRAENGPYHFPEEVTRVKGIGEETLAEFIDYVTVGEVAP